MSAHTCHAHACETRCPPKMLMCARHWRMVPRHVQDAVYATYQRGQERGLAYPSHAWFAASRTAVAEVAEVEGYAEIAARYRNMAAYSAGLADGGPGTADRETKR